MSGASVRPTEPAVNAAGFAGVIGRRPKRSDSGPIIVSTATAAIAVPATGQGVPLFARGI